MREILFRGKRVDNGEWVFSGNLIRFLDNGVIEIYIPKYNEKVTAVHDIYTDHIETITCENGAKFYKVDPSTVGQYTGLTDKNGNRIFEGDIIKAEIWYELGCYSHTKKARIEVKIPDIYELKFEKYEIIGNIHDTPEFPERWC